MAQEDNKQKALFHDAPQQLLPKPGSRYGGGSGERKTWPELVGIPSEEAERRIKEEILGINVRVIPQGSSVTCDYRPDRVRIFTDPSGKVSRAPMTG